MEDAIQEDNCGGKAPLGFIHTILDEMKCAFNSYSKDKPVSVTGKTGDDDNDSEVENDFNDVESRSYSKGEGSDGESNKCVRNFDNCADSVGTKRDKDFSSKTMAEESDCAVFPDIVSSIDETEEPTCKKSKLSDDFLDSSSLGLINIEVTPSGKRSLRSQSTRTSPDESTGVKRSARRRSKDSPRESVLQSAIARKEKSYSDMNQSEEKVLSNRNTKGFRSARLSLIDKLQASSAKVVGQTQNKTPPEQRSKSPRIQHSSPDSVKKIGSNVNKSENSYKSLQESQTAYVLRLKRRSVSESNLVLARKLNVESNVKLPLKTQSTSGAASTHTYTKTGKRRYKHFRGLRYSFSGATVRKTKRHVRERTYSENSRDTTVGQEQLISKGDEVQQCASENSQAKTEKEGIIDNNSVDDGLGMESFPSKPDQPVENKVTEVVRSESPVIADACQSAAHLRKCQPGEEEEEEEESGQRTNRHSHMPSPSPAEDSPGPSKPESTAISCGAGTAALCLCQIKTHLFVTSKSPSGELYCQAVDSMDGRWIGCSNALGTEDIRMYRASVKVPYLILCEVHVNRLLRHNSCPGCGVFCTQGKFMRCAALHLYHEDCQLLVNDKPVCPHCGLDSPLSESLLTLGVHRNPVFLPQQKPPKKYPSAKMSFCVGDRRKDVPCELPKPPVTPSLALDLPTGGRVTAEGMPASLEKDKLAQLLRVSFGMNSACPPNTANIPRYTLKNMYSAAKKGESDTLLAALASGLNPNHQFRECSMGTALHVACDGGHTVAVHILLQAGAQLDMMDREQRTPLMLAAVGRHNDIVKYLIKAGACITLKGAEGQTVLHMAAKAGNLEACHYLLSVPNAARSVIDAVDDGGWTSLVWAAEHCHLEIVRFLLEKKADPLIRDNEQNIALHWSAFSGSVDISEMMLNYSCEVNCTNTAGDTPLHIAARQNKYECVLLLLARGARVDLKNNLGETPLDCCFTKSCECYVAINLNVRLQALAKPRKSELRILSNDISKGKEVNPIQCVNTVDNEDEPRDYLYISENCYTSNLAVDRTITSLQSCRCVDRCQSSCCMCANVSIQCWYDREGRLLPEFNYADPPMLFECNQGCNCNRVTCLNRVVQNGPTARFQLFRTRTKGWGVITLRPIPKGSYVCEYIGEIISDSEADIREDDSYLFDLDNRDGETYCIDARHYGNVARFINHCCSPNLLPVRVFIEHQDLHFPRIAFFANRDIDAEEELGFDYGDKFWVIKGKSFTCTCGAEACRYSETTIGKTLEKYEARSKEEIR